MFLALLRSPLVGLPQWDVPLGDQSCAVWVKRPLHLGGGEAGGFVETHNFCRGLDLLNSAPGTAQVPGNRRFPGTRQIAVSVQEATSV